MSADQTISPWTQEASAATDAEPAAMDLACPRPASDLGNAERFVARHGGRVRYCAIWSAWFVWDGKRWARDRDGGVYRLASSTVRSIYSEAASAATVEERKKLVAHAIHSESRPSIAAMLELAKSIKPIATVPEAFDGPGTAYLLSVLNGTLDLNTMALRPHRREDFITKLAPVMFDPEARSDLWIRFLDRQVPDAEVRAFLQRAVGYTLTGSTGEEKLTFLHGPEAAGKSTFTEAVKAMLGEYAATANFEAFLRKRGNDGPRDDIARLVGTRMVLSLEVDEGQHLAEALVKNITGGDTVTARHLYSSYFEYKPAFKLWLVANHQPKANAEDGALWRRILLVPFTNTVPDGERDPAVKSILTVHAGAQSAILNWAVEGCREWRRVGLHPPRAVQVATKSYRDACDHVGAFLADAYPDELPKIISARDLRQGYEDWCKVNGEKPAPANQVAGALERHGLEKGKEGGVRVWRRARQKQKPEMQEALP